MSDQLVTDYEPSQALLLAAKSLAERVLEGGGYDNEGAAALALAQAAEVAKRVKAQR